jgi:hypothetical protein
MVRSVYVVTAIAVGALALGACNNRNGNGGATGAASPSYIGEKANVGAGTANGSTTSQTMLEQRIKQDSANGATNGGGNTRY